MLLLAQRTLPCLYMWSCTKRRCNLAVQALLVNSASYFKACTRIRCISACYDQSAISISNPTSLAWLEMMQNSFLPDTIAVSEPGVPVDRDPWDSRFRASETAVHRAQLAKSLGR